VYKYLKNEYNRAIRIVAGRIATIAKKNHCFIENSRI
jgi:hypothetical protein